MDSLYYLEVLPDHLNIYDGDVALRKRQVFADLDTSVFG